MKTYRSLLLAYINRYHSIDFELLSEEFHVRKRQTMEWLIDLETKGYIEEEAGKFYVTQTGKEYQSASWISFTGVGEEEAEETFDWDFLYIPENFE